MTEAALAEIEAVAWGFEGLPAPPLQAKRRTELRMIRILFIADLASYGLDARVLPDQQSL